MVSEAAVEAATQDGELAVGIDPGAEDVSGCEVVARVRFMVSVTGADPPVFGHPCVDECGSAGSLGVVAGGGGG